MPAWRRHTGGFTAAVRANRVPQPSQVRRWSDSQWAEAFLSTRSSAADAYLYEAGLWFGVRFAALAEEAAALDFRDSPRDLLSRIQCGAVNRDTYAFMKMMIPTAGSPVVEDLIHGRFEYPGSGIKAHPQELIESAIDGLKFAFDNASRVSQLITSRVIHQDSALLASSRNVELGSLWNLYLGAWNDCLWNDWRVYSEEPIDLVYSPASDVDDAVAVSRHRREALLLETTIWAGLRWRSSTTEERADLVGSGLRVSAVVGSGKTRQLVYSRVAIDADRAPFSWTLASTVGSLYFESMFAEPLPAAPQVTLSSLVAAWEALAHFAQAVAERFPSHGTVRNVRRLLEWAPAFSRSDIETVLAKSLACTPTVASSLASFFLRTRTEARDDVWQRPFVQVAEDAFVPIVAAVMTPNIARSVEFWSRTGGLDLAKRGPLFEDFIRSEIRTAIASGPLKLAAGVIPRSVELHADGTSEQLDLVVWLNRTLIIGEAKCLLFPSSAHEEFNYLNTVVRACHQARRKAEFCRAEPDAVIAALPELRHIPAAALVVQPVVVVSTPHLAGLVRDDVPVVDVRLLRSFLARGYMLRDTVMLADGPADGGNRVEFYSTPEEASDKLGDYLRRPPVLGDYYSRLDHEARLLPRIRDEKSTIIAYRMVAPRQPAKDFKLPVHQPPPAPRR